MCLWYTGPMSSSAFEHQNITPAMAHAIREIRRRDGAVADPIAKAKSLRKFGRRGDVGTTPVTLADLAGEDNEILLTTNGITSIVSSNNSDTQIVVLEYHTISGTDLTFGVQVTQLAGRTPVTLDVPCARVSRLYNYDTSNMLGDIYVYEGGAVSAGVPSDATEVHLQIPAGSQNSFKTATALSKEDYFLVTEFQANLAGSNTARVQLDFEVSTEGRAFLRSFEAGLGNQGTTGVVIHFDPYIIIRPNSDVRIHALSSASGTTVSAYFGGYLATVLD